MYTTVRYSRFNRMHTIARMRTMQLDFVTGTGLATFWVQSQVMK